MLRILRFLVLGTWKLPECHQHEWQIYREVTIVNEHKDRIGTKYVLQCHKCGDMKAFRDDC